VIRLQFNGMPMGSVIFVLIFTSVVTRGPPRVRCSGGKRGRSKSFDSPNNNQKKHCFFPLTYLAIFGVGVILCVAAAIIGVMLAMAAVLMLFAICISAL
jgi:hypothetical protein